MRKKTPASPSPATPGHAGRLHSRVARATLWLIGTIALIFALLICTLYFATRTESGTRMLWNNLSLLIPGQITGKLVEGRLGSGLTLADVRYVNGETVVGIDRVHGRWKLSLRPLSLTVRTLRIGTVDASLAPSPEEEEPPLRPQSLKLPLALELREVLVNKVLIRGEESDTVYENIRLQAASDSVEHILRFLEADTPAGHVSLQMKLNGSAPFETRGTATLAGARNAQKFQLKADLSGSLSELAVKANAASGEFSAKADVLATPFERVPVRHAEIHLQGFNPNVFNPAWPKARLSLDASLTPASGQSEEAVPAVAGPVSLVNALPGAWNETMLPLASAKADVLLTKSLRQLRELSVRLADGGLLEGAGELDEEGRGHLNLHAERLNLHALHTALAPTRLDGPLTIALADNAQTVDVDLSDGNIGIQAEASLAPERIVLQQAILSSGAAHLEVAGELALGADSAYSAEGRLMDFNPARFLAQQERGKKAGRKQTKSPFEASINMDFAVHGSLQPELSADLGFDIRDSTYAGQPMSGGGKVQIAGKRVLASDAQLKIAGNRASIEGSFGQPADRLTVKVDAPALARLGFGLAGSLNLDGTLRGSAEHPQIEARYHAKNLKAGALAVSSLAGNAQIDGLPGAAPAGTTKLILDARGLRSAELRLDEAHVELDGSYRDHSIRIDARGAYDTLRADLGISARGRLTDTGAGLAWAGTVSRLQNEGMPRLELAAPVQVDYAPGRLTLGAARMTLAKALIDLQHFRYAGDAIQTKGTVRQLDTAHLLTLYREFSQAALPVDSTLVLNGEWDLALGNVSTGTLRIERTSGDLSMVRGTREIPLALNELALNAALDGKQITIDARADARRIGSVEADGSIALAPGSRWSLPDQSSPLSVRVKAAVPNLNTLTFLAGPAVNVEGSAAADLLVAGTLGDPVLSGSVNGDRLGVSVYDQGIRLRDGIARLRIDKDIVDIQKFEMRGGRGYLRASGRIPLDRFSPDLKANIVADKLQLLSGPSGRLTLSGQATASNVDQQLFIGGKFTVDRALFTLPEKSAPELSDDVIVIRDSKSGKPEAAPGTDKEAEPAGPFSPRVSIEVDLGDQFRFEGAGAELRLAGNLRIESAPGETLQAFGTVRVAEGLYEAFGAELEIERGIINFEGPLNNPNINILAMRRKQEVAAGVQITGTARQPRVQLVSEPAVSEDEKLSWLVFGRSGGGDDPGQAQSAAKGAALGLLNKLGGNRIGEKLGLDEFSIGASDYGMEGAQVVNLGKEISDRLFIGFEQSIASAASVVKITYELTRHWSVVLRGGAIAGIDMAYTKRFDHLFRPPRPPQPAAPPPSSQ